MAEIDKENLEKAINSDSQNNQDSQQQPQQQNSQPLQKPQIPSQDPQQNQQQGTQQQGKQMSKEMEIGFHQGALNTLNKERSELVKMAQNVESIMQMHAQRLKELGVDIQFQSKQGQQSQGQQQNNQQPQNTQ